MIGRNEWARNRGLLAKEAAALVTDLLNVRSKFPSWVHRSNALVCGCAGRIVTRTRCVRPTNSCPPVSPKMNTRGPNAGRKSDACQIGRASCRERVQDGRVGGSASHTD